MYLEGALDPVKPVSAGPGGADCNGGCFTRSVKRWVLIHYIDEYCYFTWAYHIRCIRFCLFSLYYLFPLFPLVSAVFPCVQTSHTSQCTLSHINQTLWCPFLLGFTVKMPHFIPFLFQSFSYGVLQVWGWLTVSPSFLTIASHSFCFWS